MLTNGLTGTTGHGDHRDEHPTCGPDGSGPPPNHTPTANLRGIPIRPRSGGSLLTRRSAGKAAWRWWRFEGFGFGELSQFLIAVRQGIAKSAGPVAVRNSADVLGRGTCRGDDGGSRVESRWR